MASQILANVEEEWMKKRKGVLLEKEGEGVHQIFSFVWADNFWIMSHSKEHLEQILNDLIEEAGKVGLELKLASLWWTSTHASGHLERENVRRCGRTNAVSKQGFLEGHYDFQEQGCSVEGKMSASSGPCVCRLFLWK